MQKEESKIDYENSIGPWLGKTAKIVDGYLHEELCKHGLDLSKEQMIVLKKLHDQDGLNQNELAFLTFRDKSSLTRLLSKMEKKNYIRRKQNKEDRRINEVYLTDEGRNTFKKTRPAISNLLNKIEQNITVEEKHQIIGILKKVQQNLTSQEAVL